MNEDPQPTETPTIESLRIKYTEVCRALGEKTFMIKCLESEVHGLNVILRDLNKEAADLATSKEAASVEKA